MRVRPWDGMLNLKHEWKMFQTKAGVKEVRVRPWDGMLNLKHRGERFQTRACSAPHNDSCMGQSWAVVPPPVLETNSFRCDWPGFILTQLCYSCYIACGGAFS